MLVLGDTGCVRKRNHTSPGCSGVSRKKGDTWPSRGALLAQLWPSIWLSLTREAPALGLVDTPPPERIDLMSIQEAAGICVSMVLECGRVWKTDCLWKNGVAPRPRKTM